MSDFKGIKKSDSIENFYDIEKVIGRGKSYPTPSYHLTSRGLWRSGSGKTLVQQRVQSHQDDREEAAAKAQHTHAAAAERAGSADESCKLTPEVI